MQAKIKLKDEPDWVELEKLKLEAEAVGFYLSAHPLDSYRDGMEKLGVKNCSEVFRNIQLGDMIRAKLAGCVNSFKKKFPKRATVSPFWNSPTRQALLKAFCFRKPCSAAKK